MQALKITFRFSAPVLRDSEQPIHLDALIASAVMRESEELAPEENAWRAADDLSAILGRTTGDQWVWKASMLMFKPIKDIEWVNQIRKCEPERWYDDAGAAWVGKGKQNELGIRPTTFGIDPNSGHNRGYQMITVTQWMSEAVAWAVGDKEALEHYLGMIEHVGKKTANGYGRVARSQEHSGLTVEDALPEEADNWLLRTLPTGQAGKPGVQYEPVMQCLRAPYWRKLDRVIALEPIV